MMAAVRMCTRKAISKDEPGHHVGSSRRHGSCIAQRINRETTSECPQSRGRMDDGRDVYLREEGFVGRSRSDVRTSAASTFFVCLPRLPTTHKCSAKIAAVAVGKVVSYRASSCEIADVSGSSGKMLHRRTCTNGWQSVPE